MGRSRLVLGLWLAHYTIGHTIIGLHEVVTQTNLIFCSVFRGVASLWARRPGPTNFISYQLQ